MTCKDCIHCGLCYKENDYENFPEVCGSFIPESILNKEDERTCKNCKYNDISINELKPCSLCCHNRIDKFERKEEENE